SQIVRAVSSCRISWLQAAAYQAFNGKGFGWVMASSSGSCRGPTDMQGGPTAPAARSPRGQNLSPPPSGDRFARLPTRGGGRKRFCPPYRAIEVLIHHFDLAALIGSLTLAMVSNSTL